MLPWMDVKEEFLKVLYLGFFLIYINDLPDKLVSNPKLFADATSLFSTVTDPNVTANQINNDLHNISTWAYQWKMNFNPDTSKQAQEVLFSRKGYCSSSTCSTIIQYMKPKASWNVSWFQANFSRTSWEYAQ